MKRFKCTESLKTFVKSFFLWNQITSLLATQLLFFRLSTAWKGSLLANSSSTGEPEKAFLPFSFLIENFLYTTMIHFFRENIVV